MEGGLTIQPCCKSAKLHWHVKQKERRGLEPSDQRYRAPQKGAKVASALITALAIWPLNQTVQATRNAIHITSEPPFSGALYPASDLSIGACFTMGRILARFFACITHSVSNEAKGNKW